MKWLKIFIIFSIVVAALGFIGIGIISVDMDETDLPEAVYEEQSDLGVIINTKMFDLFLGTVTSEYTIIEEVINLEILNSIRENINSSYDPLGTCDTTDCNYIIYDNNYYVNYTWAQLNEDNQLVVYVSFGSELAFGFNSIFSMTFDIDIDYVGFGIELKLSSYAISDIELSQVILEMIFSRIDTEQIENDVSTGTLDLEEYTYNISFNPLS